MSARQSDVNGRKLMDRLAPDSEAFGALRGVLATTYEFDASFFELDFLPTCLGLGAWDDKSWTSRVALERSLATMDGAVLLMDGRRYRGRPRSLHVDVRPAVGPRGELLHAKVLLLVYERAVRLLVGSANLTEAGYRANREVVLPFVVTPERTAAASIVREALQAMPEYLEAWWSDSAERIRRLALAQLDEWSSVTAPDSAHFMWSGPGHPLWSRFLDAWPGEDQVQAISIVSPFWSEETGRGPVQQIIEQLASRDALAKGARLQVYADAAIGGTRVCTPHVPSSLLALDVAKLGVSGHAVSVDPTVLSEEVGGRTDFLPKRRLHAKVVLLEGEKFSLVYLGSANFTFNGWGFTGAPGAANVEAGVALLRTGKERSGLRALLPATSGDPIELGSGTITEAGHEEESTDVTWPSFLRDAVLAPNPAAPRELALHLGLIPEKVQGEVSVSIEPEGPVLFQAAAGASDAKVVVILTPDQLGLILRLKELHVSWWALPEGQRFPVNLDFDARVQLPLGEVDSRVGERLLLAYYQGQIAFADLFPPPADYADGSTGTSTEALDSEVDTSRIQSYQMREFVEALAGIDSDLQSALGGTEASIRLALLGPVSPLGLGRAVAESVRSGQRSATAGAFQLVEISACLQRASAPIQDPERQKLFEKHAEVVRTELATHLDELRTRDPDHFGPKGAFQRYARAIQPNLLRTR